MPRTSEKAQITTQLSQIWLANVISTVLVSENDLLSIFYFFETEGNRRGPEATGQASTARGSRSLDREVFNYLRLNLGLREFGIERMDVMQSVEGIEEEEMMEGVELLWLFVSSIWYLAPREPIPRSEYLFKYHVC